VRPANCRGPHTAVPLRLGMAYGSQNQKVIATFRGRKFCMDPAGPVSMPAAGKPAAEEKLDKVEAERARFQRFLSWRRRHGCPACRHTH
jgi:hypothetical protein